MSNVQSKIDNFVEYFNKTIEVINTIEVESNYDFLRQALFVNIIDTLSKTIIDDTNDKNTRFTNTIERFGNWKDCNKINLIHLLRILDLISSPDIKGLRDFCFEQKKKWKIGSPISISTDPDFDTIKSMWTDNISVPGFKKFRLEYLTHKYLLYKFRCFLAHESRKPGYGLAFPEDDYPFFHQVGWRDGSTTWELCYPTLFFKKITKTILDTRILC